jgi:hypothetical protein
MTLHIDIPTQAQVATLLDERAPVCVSIFLPTSPLPQDADAARIEFKNLSAEAVCQLDGRADISEQLDDLEDDQDFWGHLATSLAVFATPDGVRTFRLPTARRRAGSRAPRARRSGCASTRGRSTKRCDRCWQVPGCR